MKVIFMGTPAFAVPALKELIASEHNVVAVYTKEPKPAGRGYKELKSPIHVLAEENNINVFTPKNFKNESDVDAFKAHNADIVVVAAYGLILPITILNATPNGAINVHPSLLPRWRGAAPIQHTILNGDKDSAVCIMKMDEGLDTGDIIIQHKFMVDSTTTASLLHDFCAALGGKLILEALEQIINGSAKYVKQENAGLTYANKLTKQDEEINWQEPVFKTYCRIKTFSPRPGAYFKHNGNIIKILDANYEVVRHNYTPGEIIDDKFRIACCDGVLQPLLLQREGKKAIYLDAFLRGYEISLA